MGGSCAIIASSVTPPTEEEGVEVDRVEGVGVAVDLDRLERSCALLRLTIPASIAPMTEKWSEEGKETSKWCKSLVIPKGKMSLSRVAKSL